MGELTNQFLNFSISSMNEAAFGKKPKSVRENMGKNDSVGAGGGICMKNLAVKALSVSEGEHYR